MWNAALESGQQLPRVKNYRGCPQIAHWFKIFLPLSKDRVGYIIHVFQSLLSNRRNSYFWQMWLTQPIRLLPSFRKRMEILRNIYWTHHVRFHHFDEVYIIQHERNALNFMVCDYRNDFWTLSRKCRKIEKHLDIRGSIWAWALATFYGPENFSSRRLRLNFTYFWHHILKVFRYMLWVLLLRRFSLLLEFDAVELPLTLLLLYWSYCKRHVTYFKTKLLRGLGSTQNRWLIHN